MKKRFFSFLFITFLSLSCHPNQTNNYPLDPDVTNVNGSVFYEIFVGSFCDSNHDGVGDLRGIASKLDYLEDLGIKGLWLTPIHPSDTYHKYDVKDYLAIEKEFGTLDDFDYLISEANKRHIDIILDLVINHSSSNHEWFKDAEKDKRDNVLDPTSKRFYYNWSDTQQKGYRYSNVAQSYYEGQFDTSMPDLNLDNEYVINEIENIINFWLNRGVKGFRLDAVTSFFSGKSSKNIAFLTYLNDYIKSQKEDAFIIGEAWEEMTNVLYNYASSGMHFFNFPMAEVNPKSVGLSVIQQTGNNFARALVASEVALKERSTTSKNALILSNHDMDRSGGYLKDEKAKIAASAYLLTPGYPFMYYGEEIGLKGSRGGANTDANRRLPMIWLEKDTSEQTNNPPGTTYDFSLQVSKGAFDLLNVPNSLLNHYKKVINLRNKYPIFHDGLYYHYQLHDNIHLAMFKIEKDEDIIYLIHNFSDHQIEANINMSNLEIIDEIKTMQKPASLNKDLLTLEAYSSVILK